MHKKDRPSGLAGARRRMIVSGLQARGIRDPRILAVMKVIPREQFVPLTHRALAYEDAPQPIGLDQTISQPYIVALMTEQLQVTPDDVVLEIGTGSGYQTAVLARLVHEVFSIERLSTLADGAKQVLAAQGVENVTFGVGDGSLGWQPPRCFDRILVTAAAPTVPAALWQQLRVGGILVAPIGPGSVQTLVSWTKQPDGACRETAICQVRFVKLIGRQGFKC
ncbi:protein-L-isoaspartate(D-aspartate) O-methyltransferase [Planctomycetota bacterium]